MKRFFKRDAPASANGVQKRLVTVEKNLIMISPGAMQEIRLKPDDFVVLSYDDEKRQIAIEKSSDIKNGFLVGYERENGPFIAAKDFFDQFGLDGKNRVKIAVNDFGENGFEFAFENRLVKAEKKKQSVKNFVRVYANSKQMTFSPGVANFLKLNEAIRVRFYCDKATGWNVLIKTCRNDDFNGHALSGGKISIGRIWTQMNWEYPNERIPVTLDRKNKTISFKPPKKNETT
jgi:hypothetical protein